jgi:non-ribosomal peptide synthase protein (TIGR01720 family)
MTFNYLGQFDQVLKPLPAKPSPAGAAEGGRGAEVLGPAPEAPGRARAAANRRTHLLDIAAAVAGGRLSVSWTYCRAAHDAATVQRLADSHIAALRALIAHCRSPEAGGYSPSDFPLADLGQRQLDRVVKKVTRSENAHS